MYAGCRCPRCPDAVLKATQREGCDVLACRRCGGGLLGAAVGLRLLAVLEPDVPPVHEGMVASPCPVCRAGMRLVLASAASVEVDVCAKHGVWFDGDDLVAVARAAARALGRQVPQAVDAFAERARVRRPEASSPEAPRWSPEPTQGARRSVRPSRSFGDPSSPLEVARDVGTYVGEPLGAVAGVVGSVGDVVLVPVELTFGLIGGIVDLLD